MTNFPCYFRLLPIIIFSHFLTGNFLGQANSQVVPSDTIEKEIQTLINIEIPAGQHEVDINSDGRPSGLYFYSLQAGSFTKTKEIILLK